MNAQFKISVYDTVKLRAEFNAGSGHQWINIYFTGVDTDETPAVTLFFDDRAMAEAYANAINSVNDRKPAIHPDGRPEWTGKQAQGPHLVRT